MTPRTDQQATAGIVTFLFTDIEGSTRRWESDAEEMRAALEEHDRVLRAEVENHHGEVFKHTGDGMCAVFPIAARCGRSGGSGTAGTGVAGADGHRDR